MMLFIPLLSGMPPAEVPQEVSMPMMPQVPQVSDMGQMSDLPSGSAMEAIPTEIPGQQTQVGMPTITPEGKVVQPTEKKDESKKGNKKDDSSSNKKESPSVLQMEELKVVDEGLKGVNKVIDLFVGPFEDFGEAIPPTVSSLFGPIAHIHWSLIIRSLQKRVKKSREAFAVFTGKVKKVEVKKEKKIEQPVDFMAAMQEEIKKKEPEQKKKIGLVKLMPKQVVKKVYDQLLTFVKKVTHPLEKKSLAVAELFEPLPPIPFLITVSDVQLALHILSLQQRMSVIEESLKNNLESLDEIKKREMKNAVKVVDLDPMVAMAAQAEKTSDQKKADEKKKKKEEKQQKPGVKFKETKEVQKIYSAFKKLDSMVSSVGKPIEKLTKDLPAMPIPLVSFIGATLAISSIPMVFFFGIGIPQALIGTSLYGITQAQFAIYIRNLQQLLGKIEEDIKRYQESKKLAAGAYDPTKVLEQAQMQMTQPSDDQGGQLSQEVQSEESEVTGVPSEAMSMPEASMPMEQSAEMSAPALPSE